MKLKSDTMRMRTLFKQFGLVPNKYGVQAPRLNRLLNFYQRSNAIFSLLSA